MAHPNPKRNPNQALQYDNYRRQLARHPHQVLPYAFHAPTCPLARMYARAFAHTPTAAHIAARVQGWLVCACTAARFTAW